MRESKVTKWKVTDPSSGSYRGVSGCWDLGKSPVLCWCLPGWQGGRGVPMFWKLSCRTNQHAPFLPLLVPECRHLYPAPLAREEPGQCVEQAAACGGDSAVHRAACYALSDRVSWNGSLLHFGCRSWGRMTWLPVCAHREPRMWDAPNLPTKMTPSSAAQP